jgi:hypothetical protein
LRTALVTDARREVFEASARSPTGKGSAEQQASMGRSTKWRE